MKMTLLPLLMDILDGDSFLTDRIAPSSSFAVSFLPQELRRAERRHLRPTHSCYRRDWRLDRKHSGMGRGDKRGGDEGFQVCVDVEDFAPKEISVKTVDRWVVVEGRHEEKEEGQGHVSRHFVRRYELPEECDVKEVVSTLSSDGVLTVKAPPRTKAVEGSERVIQIQQTGPAHLTIKDSSKEEKKKETSGAEEEKMTE